MKAKILDVQGESMKEVELPSCFSEKIREDMIQKVYEAAKMKQPYAPFVLAGMQGVASGIIRHQRRKWKTAYGYGISRIPRKIFSRSGTRFSWQGAEIASTRGGRQAHPPKVEGMQRGRKINLKEFRKTLRAAIAACASEKFMKKKYPNLEFKFSLPLVFESKITELKTKELDKLMSKLMNSYAEKVLIITASDENLKAGKFETAKASNLKILQLASGGKAGRLTAFTEKSLEELKKL